MEWIWLAGGVLLQAAGATSLKMSATAGQYESLVSIMTWVFYLIAFYFLEMAMRTIDLGTAFAVWSGGGIIVVTLIGVGMLGDGISLYKMTSIGLIVLGVVGLNLERIS